MSWIDTTGGPLILISRITARVWNKNDDAESDYDKACSVEDHIGIVEKAGEQVLVLGDEPLLTTIMKRNAEILIARWNYYSEDTKIAERHIADVDLDDLLWEKFTDFPITADEYLLMDASLIFEELNEESSIIIAIEPGKYNVWTAHYNPDSQTSFALHRLQKNDISLRKIF